MKKLAAVVAGLFVLFSLETSVIAQERPPEELDQLFGPIALYPDPLIAEILSGSTFPSQIVVADRYMAQGGDAAQVGGESWDPSVQALCHYPNVLKWLDDNLAWTTQMGQAFATQPDDVMASIQRLRAQAQSLGNLPSTPQETVTSDDGDIEIEPANPDDMYIPDYSPTTIYYQPGVYCTFGIGVPLGVWLVHDWDWRSHRMISWGPGHPRPRDWWHESPGGRHSYVAENHPPAWHASGHTIVNHGGYDRGYEPRTIARSAPQPFVPRPEVRRTAEAPRADTIRPRAAEGRIDAARAETHPAFRSPSVAPPRSFAPTERAEPFGGFQSAPAARESSVRGQESRATIGGGAGRGGGSVKH